MRFLVGLALRGRPTGRGFTRKRSAVRMRRTRVATGSNGRRSRPTARRNTGKRSGVGPGPGLRRRRAEVEDLRDVSRDALHLRSEVERLETLLATIGVDTRKRSTIASLRIETGRLQAGNEALRTQLQEVESDRDALRAQVETLSRAQFGRKSEQGRKGTGHRTGPGDKGEPGKRGPRPGGATHGRTPRPELARKREGHNPPPEALLCPCCGAPRLANGSHRSELIEVAVKAHGAGHRPDPLAQDLPVS